MSAATATTAKPRRRTRVRPVLGIAAAIVLVAAMALDTKVVRIGSAASVAPGTFSPASYGAAEFPKVQAAVSDKAVDAATLAAAIAKDQAAAVSKYGVTAAGGTPVFPVKFTGVFGQSDSGVYDVAVPNLPAGVKIKVQTGPAILGTDLRDVTGTISFGQFTNQIEYQNAAAALNKQMKKDVLAKVDVANLSGKTIAVTGAFQLTDPTTWTVTPASLVVR